MLENIGLILLDEPTNHMDMDSIIALEEALKHYSGTVILISHDIVFINNIEAKVLQIKKETSKNSHTVYRLS